MMRIFNTPAVVVCVVLVSACGCLSGVAEETSTPVITGLDSTTLSGSVDTSTWLPLSNSNPSAIPESETYGLVAGLGLCALAMWRRRRG